MGDVQGPRRLYRDADNRMIAGVCGGLAEYFQIDPALVRLAFIAFSFVALAPVVFYVAAWIIIPKKRE
ncbi:MAG: PspC domain-containing protein [bacterium]